MFQKMPIGTSALCTGTPAPASTVNIAGDGRLRRQAARKNRTTANHGMFYRRDSAYLHV